MNGLDDRVRTAEGRLFSRYHASLTEHLLDLKVGGSSLRLRILEAGAGSPVLLLHPAAWFAAQWSPLLPHLPEHRLLCLDLPGHGLSDGVDYRSHDPRDHTVAMLRQLLSELGLGAVPIVGNSLGGMAALWLAIDEPRLVSRLVILGLPGSVLPGSRPDLALALLSIPGVNRLLLSLPSSPKRSRSLLKAPLGRAALARTPQEMFEIHHLASRRPEFALTLSTFMETTLRWRSPRPGIVLSDSEMAGLHQPVRFLWGEDDIYGAPEIGDRAARLMRHAAITAHPGGHFPQLDDPERCGRCISEFLKAAPLA